MSGADRRQSEDRFSKRIRRTLPLLSPALRRVAQYFDSNRVEAMSRSAAEIAVATGSSDAAVVRTAKALGFAGLPEMKQELAAVTGLHHTAADKLAKTFDAAREPEAAADLVLTRELAVISGLAEALDRKLIVDAASTLARADRIIVFGHGLAASMASYAGLLLERYGKIALVMDQRGFALIDQLLGLGERDALLLTVIGQSYPEMQLVVGEAERLDLPIVRVTDWPDALGQHDKEIVLVIPNPHPSELALQGGFFICLEALALTLAALEPLVSIQHLEQLSRLRGRLRQLEHSRNRWRLGDVEAPLDIEEQRRLDEI